MLAGYFYFMNGEIPLDNKIVEEIRNAKEGR